MLRISRNSVIILFMRAGFVVGRAGIFHALLILFLAKGITTMTAFSISAVSTNTRVAGGGAYFLISRALGPESGGAIGLALFIAQAVSVPFYTLGFTEALVRSFPQAAPHFQFIALTAALALFLISHAGARWAIKTQYLIMTFLGLSIVAILTGALMNFSSARFVENWGSAYLGPEMSFWRAFAIYFPAATGILAGVNMSGVFAATLSSALGSFLGAPRVLQAVSRDHVIDLLAPFAQGSQRGDEPHRALWLTLGITLAVIFWAGADVHGGAFNTLAAVVFIGFFLPEKTEALQFQRNFEKLLSPLPTTLLVCSSGKADLMA